MKILALDVGKKRIGAAICDRLEIAANPHSVIKAGKTAVDEVVKLIEIEEVEGIVIGMPTSFDGSEGESCQRSRYFKNELEKGFLYPLNFMTRGLPAK
jgi:putative Holliday junction resolvase